MERTENFDNNDQLDRPHVPYGIISQHILSRFPIETIYNFRSVCKLWCSLPNDPKFVVAHLCRSLQTSNLIGMSYKNAEDHMYTLLSFYSIEASETGNVATLLFTIPLDVDFYSMEPSFDGLVCFSALLTKKIYVCNPSTHELLQLPHVGFHDARSELAGFGFDYSTGTYKVLRAFVDAYHRNVKWFIYTLGSGDDNWRQLDHLTPDHRIQPGKNAYIHGVVHWIFEYSNNSVPCGILAFDFCDEMFRILPLPNCPAWRLYLQCQKFHAAMRLKVIGGYLRLITTLGGSKSSYWTLCFWTLKDYTSHEWTLDIGFHVDILSYHMRLYMPVPVDIRNGKVFFSAGSKLYCHDLEGGITTEINDGMPEEANLETIKHFQANFSESLIPISYDFWYQFELTLQAGLW